TWPAARVPAPASPCPGTCVSTLGIAVRTGLMCAQQSWAGAGSARPAPRGGPVQPRPGLNPAQDRDLVAQHEQFGVLGRGGPAKPDEPSREPGEDQVQQANRRG